MTGHKIEVHTFYVTAKVWQIFNVFSGINNKVLWVRLQFVFVLSVLIISLLDAWFKVISLFVDICNHITAFYLC